jgi:hypothetical protein
MFAVQFTTPLWIIALLIFTGQKTLDIASKTTGWLQIVLTIFGMLLILSISIAFFVILLKKPNLWLIGGYHGDK